MHTLVVGTIMDRNAAEALSRAYILTSTSAVPSASLVNDSTSWKCTLARKCLNLHARMLEAGTERWQQENRMAPTYKLNSDLISLSV